MQLVHRVSTEDLSVSAIFNNNNYYYYYQYIIVRPKVDQRAGQLSLPHVMNKEKEIKLKHKNKNR